ncbi:MAG: TetR/AcrR family transcriptional regulator [Clostridiales bacterium]|nr:TetR/AcrR family transcriptional regulator [Clostridiales bacterium]MBR6484291.1 TetR/AcrR family transcriptional regulator [Clostridiales bacterium]
MPRVSEEYVRKKREEIVEAAYRVCVRKPVTSIEMKDVIAETGFSHGVVYQYYSDLDEVLADLVVKINREHRIDDRIDKILKKAGDDLGSAIRKICSMLSDYMQEVGVDLMRVSIYCDVLAMSEPERVLKVAGKINSEGGSPLIYLVTSLTSYLTDIVQRKGLTPVRSIDEILQFFIASFQGIQMGYVLTESLKIEGIEGRYKTDDMFAALADSVVLMLEAKTC